MTAMGYTPNPVQTPIHQARERVVLVSGGEGSGKSLVTAAEIAARYGTWKLVYLVGPKYEQAHKELDYIYQYLSTIGATNANLYSRPRAGKAILTTKDGARVETLSSEDGPKAITGTGESPDILAMCEAGKQGYDIYLACRGRVARSRGLLILSGTIEASNRWYSQKINQWQSQNAEGAHSFVIPTWTNTALYPLGEQDPEILALKATYPADQFLERFGARPCPPTDLVFREFDYATHVADAPYWQGDPAWKNQEVQLAVDPGYAGAYAVAALQRQGDVVWVIDQVGGQYMVAEDVIHDCMERPWWWLVSGGVVDIAGRQHQGLASHVEVWAKHARKFDGTGIGLRSNRVGIAEGIARTRTFLKNPLSGETRLHFDPRCKSIFDEFDSYKYRKAADGKPQSENPIDANNHWLKALGYWLYDVYGPTDATAFMRRVKKLNLWAFAEN